MNQFENVWQKWRSKDHLGRLFHSLRTTFWDEDFNLQSWLHWIQTFRVTFLGWAGDRGTVGTSRGKRHDIEHIGLHGTQTYKRLILLGEDRGRGLGTGKGYNILWSSPVNTLGPGGPRLRCIGERINRTFANKLRDEPRISLPAQGLPKDVTTHTCTVQQQPDDHL